MGSTFVFFFRAAHPVGKAVAAYRDGYAVFFLTLAAMDWIKIADELPQTGQEYWAWDGKEVSRWVVNQSWGKTGADFRKHCAKHGITHWMPFVTPSPP